MGTFSPPYGRARRDLRRGQRIGDRQAFDIKEILYARGIVPIVPIVPRLLNHNEKTQGRLLKSGDDGDDCDPEIRRFAGPRSQNGA